MKQYLELIQTIKQEGTVKPAARENMPGTTSLFGYQFRHNLAEGFPLLTTKKLNFKHIIVELLWFLRGDTNVKYLIDNGCNIWNQDAYNYYKKIISNEELEDLVLDILIEDTKESKMRALTFEEFIINIKNNNLLKCKNYTLGDCGVQYGKLWRDLKGVNGDGLKTSTDQLHNLIEGLKNGPMSRRHIIDAWNPSTLNDMALNACHCLVQFNCRPLNVIERNAWSKKNIGNGFQRGYLTEKELNECNVPKYYLDCQMYQRSADTFLGVPFNIASYALLTEILSKICNMVPGEFIHTFGDVHIYDNHKEQIEEQLKREPSKLPTLKLGSNIDWNSNIDDVVTCANLLPKEAFNNLFKLENYNPQARIKGKLSTGLK